MSTLKILYSCGTTTWRYKGQQIPLRCGVCAGCDRARFRSEFVHMLLRTERTRRRTGGYTVSMQLQRVDDPGITLK